MAKQTKNNAERKQRVRNRNEKKIISAAEKIFSEKGYNTATIQEIADKLNMPKANIHYYFPTKKDLYLTVIMKLRDLWKNEVDVMMTKSDAKTALRIYVRSLLDISFENPHAHKIWNWEMMRGARNLTSDIRESMKKRNKKRNCANSELGRYRTNCFRLKPQNLLYFLWGITTHFSHQRDQIKILNGNKHLSKEQREKVYDDAVNMILRGVIIE